MGSVVRAAATTEGVIDTFTAIAACTAIALMLLVAHQSAPPGPASHRPLFGLRPGERT